MRKQIGILFLLAISVLSSCGENPTVPTDPDRGKWIYYSKIDDNGTLLSSKIFKINIETNELVSMIDSALIYSPPVNGKMLVEILSSIDRIRYKSSMALYSTSGNLIKKLNIDPKYLGIDKCILSPDGKNIAFIANLDKGFGNFYPSEVFILRENGKVIETGIKPKYEVPSFNFTPDSKGLIGIQNDDKVVYFDIGKASTENLTNNSSGMYPSSFRFPRLLNDKSFLSLGMIPDKLFLHSYLIKFSKSGSKIISPNYDLTIGFAVNKNGNDVYYCSMDFSTAEFLIYRYDNLNDTTVLIDSIPFVFDGQEMFGWNNHMLFNDVDNCLYLHFYNDQRSVPCIFWKLDLNAQKKEKLDIFLPRYPGDVFLEK